MHNLSPPHPGHILRDEVLPSLQLTVAQAAGELHVARQTIYRILSGQAGVTPEMALRLARLSGTRAEAWLALQQRHDLWHAERDLKAVLAAIPARKLPRSSSLSKDAHHGG